MATYKEIAEAAQARAEHTAAARAAVLEQLLLRRPVAPDREGPGTALQPRSGGEAAEAGPAEAGPAEAEPAEAEAAEAEPGEAGPADAEAAEAEAAEAEAAETGPAEAERGGEPDAALKELSPDFFTQEINDSLDISFLDKARTAARAVGRLVHDDGAEGGTCFLISPDLLLTNNHVIPDPDAAAELGVEFNFELDVNDRPTRPTRHRLAPEKFFHSNGDLAMDFTLVALGDHEEGPVIPDPAFCPLPPGGSTHPLGFYVNLVQHPRGEPKQVVLRDNRVVHKDGTVLLYTGETRPGSSGCPGFNDRWEVVVLHHFAGPSGAIRLPSGLELPTEVNEGIDISAIVDDLVRLRDTLEGKQQELLVHALAGGILAEA